MGDILWMCDANGALWMLISKSAQAWLAGKRTTGWQACQGSESVKERLSEGGEKELERSGVNQVQSPREKEFMKADPSQIFWKRGRLQRLVKTMRKMRVKLTLQKAAWKPRSQGHTINCTNCILCLLHPRDGLVCTRFVPEACTLPAFKWWHPQGQESCHLFL